MKSILFLCLFSISSFVLRGQITVTGNPPSVFPTKTTYAKLHYDSTKKVPYKFKFPKWYYQGKLIRAGIPSDSTYSVAGVLITISYEDADLWNVNTNSFWYFNNGVWANSKTLNLDSLLNANNIWTGKNTFQDSLRANKGLISGGLIDTKGVNTEGTTTKPAINIVGVQSEKDTIVATNLSLDGRYGTIGFDCSTGIKAASLPNETTTIGWYFIIRKEDDSGNDLQIKTSTGVLFYTLKSKMFVVIKNKNGIWKRER
jgi:hypothetical protein